MVAVLWPGPRKSNRPPASPPQPKEYDRNRAKSTFKNAIATLDIVLAVALEPLKIET